MKRVIVDVDAGTDDAVAILLLIAAHIKKTIKIEAFTCVNGNTDVENVARNVVRLLEITKTTNIPVYKGAHEPLLLPEQKPTHFHGKDGFGDLKNIAEPNTSIVEKELAPIAIGKIITKNPGEIYIVALGPLTNIALSIKLFPTLPTNVKEVYLMGGNHKAVGNCTKTAEFNFHIDPESAQILLEKIKAPIYIMTWETTLEASEKLLLTWVDEVLVPLNNPAFNLIFKAEKSIYPPSRVTWIPCDAFLAAAFLYPDKIIKKKTSFHACIELHGFKTRGQVVLDHLKQEEDNVVIIEDIFEEAFKQCVYESVKIEY